MNRTDVLRQISSICRQDHHASLFAVGWLALDLHQEALEDLLRGLQALPPDPVSSTHLAAFLERWGRLPDPR